MRKNLIESLSDTEYIGSVYHNKDDWHFRSLLLVQLENRNTPLRLIKFKNDNQAVLKFFDDKINDDTEEEKMSKHWV